MSSATETAVAPPHPVLVREAKALTDIADRLAARFPHITRARVIEIVGEIHQHFDDAPIREFVPVLVEREARHRLSHLPQIITA
jgi:hypothetical protein